MKRIFARLITIILAVLLAGCAPSVAVVTETPAVSATPVPAPSASPADEPTETPELMPTPVTIPEPIFIFSDDVWAGAKEEIYPEIGGDYLATGYVFIEPGTKIFSPCDGVASFHRFTMPSGITMDYIVITVTLNKSDDPNELLGNMENYPISFRADSIIPSFDQYQTIKEGDELGVVNSANFDIAYTPEQQKERGCLGYNLSIRCPIVIQSYGVEEPFADALTLKDKIRFIVDLAKAAQSESTKED